MKNHFVLFFIACALYLMPCNAQSKRDKIWVSGSGVSFKIIFEQTGIVNKTLDTISSPYFDIGHSNICDTNGNLILCSDGFHIYDSNAILIDGGDSLVPMHYINHYSDFSSYSQSSIFLPMENNKYYFVTPSNSEGNLCYSCHNDVLYYAIVDMNANGGAGKVVKRMRPLMEMLNFAKPK
jgi:hypothetical protein